MDYDATDIAAVYDRGRDHGPAYLNLWMNVVASHVKGRRLETILDLGCGTGRFAEALAEHFNAEVVGLDPSGKMLEQAAAKQSDARVRYMIGHGESIPLTDRSVDLVFTSMTFHHFENPAQAARECRRVLRDTGAVFLRAGTCEQIPGYPYVDFFPDSRPILEETLHSTEFIRQVFESAGFRLDSAEVITQEISPSYAAYAEKLSAGADSVLARLSEQDFAAGIEALRSHADRIDPQAVCESIDVFVFR